VNGGVHEDARVGCVKLHCGDMDGFAELAPSRTYLPARSWHLLARGRSMNSVIARYSQGALTGRHLQSAIDEAMQAVAADDAELSRLGLSKDEFLSVRFEVTEPGGFIAEGILLAIAVGAGSNLAADAAKALWNKVLKRIRDKHGDDAVGPEKKPGPEDGHVSG
jgi:hypothetical protein